MDSDTLREHHRFHPNQYDPDFCHSCGRSRAHPLHGPRITIWTKISDWFSGLFQW